MSIDELLRTDTAAAVERTRAIAAEHGLDLDRNDAAAVIRITGGWLDAIERLLDRVDGPITLASLTLRPVVAAELVAERLNDAGESASRIAAQLARLQPCTDALLAAAEVKASYDVVRSWGLPVAGDAGGWSFPEPIRRILVDREPADRTMLEEVAAQLVVQADPARAVLLLMGAGLRPAALDLLGNLRPSDIERLDVAELRAFVAAFDSTQLAAAPRVLIALAQLCGAAGFFVERTELLERAERSATDPTVARAVRAERLADDAREGLTDLVREHAPLLLAELTAEETRTRARVLAWLGHALAFERQSASLAAAESALREAAVLYEVLGDDNNRAHVLITLGYHVHFAQRHLETALHVLDQAEGLMVGRSRQRTSFLSFRADVRRGAGDLEGSRLDAEDGWASAISQQDSRGAAYAAWSLVLLAGDSGDATVAHRWIDRTLAHASDWYDHPAGIQFLGDASEALARCDDVSGSMDLLARASARADLDPRAAEIPLFSSASLNARHGDPVTGLSELAACRDSPEFPPGDGWRLELLSALCELRRGDATAAGRRAASAFDMAEAAGVVHAPLAIERAAARRLIGLAARSGSVVAAALAEDVSDGWLKVLGGFALRRQGTDIALPSGQPTRLVQLLAVRGGRGVADEIVEELWPEVEPAVGRKRLRNVLNRVVSAYPDLVVRDGETLAVHASVTIDAVRFDDAYRAALAGGPDAIDHARTALTLATGPLLPDQPYDSVFAPERERIVRHQLRLLDLLADGAETSGDPVTAAGRLQEALELDPADEARALRLAQLLIASQRRVEARATLTRCEHALAELGLVPGPAHTDLARSLAA